MGADASDAGAAGRVHRLPDALIDQIAAGEVIERPASVVKELVENALDAGAQRVRVEIRDGGRAWIAVTDDGSGMSPADARLALERHATSKLRDAAGLSAIATYGFRGEALPAIASVSSLRLRTRERAAAEGFEIAVHAGTIESARPLGAAVGTCVEVADLFANVPARRKFLKSATTEWGHVADWLARAALALPGVHFDLFRDDRPGAAWPAVADPLDRIAAVLGESIAETFVPVAHEEGALRVQGFTSRPDHHRATAAGIYVFVQRRPVRDRIVQHALQELYRDVLPRGRHPSAVLFLEVPAGAVDVNVHPAKWEVRFADPRAIHQLVRHAVQKALSRRSWLGAAPADPAPAARADREGSAPRPPGPAAGQGDWIFATSPPHAAPASAARAETGDVAPLRLSELSLLGQLAATYLLLEGKDELLLVDQHAAHERVLFERLRASLLSSDLERQALLVPLAVELAPSAQAALLGQRALAESLGFEVEPFGEGAVALRAVPALLADRDPASLLRTLADELAASPAALSPSSALRALAPADRILATLACHGARRKGDVLDAREQRALLDAIDTIPWAPTCPHGRPVVVPFTLFEIERRFGRR
jgi:DNA mismatch repair protein MutL